MITTDEAKKILGAVVVSFPSYKPTDMQMLLDMYKVMFKDYTYQEVMVGLQSYIATDTTGFAPSIGQIIDKIHKVTQPEELNPNEAWSLVYKALCNSTYNADKEFEKLPPLIQKTVGSPESLRSLASSSDFNEEVEKSLFFRNYQATIKRSQEDAKLPESLKQALSMKGGLGIETTK